jgi:hypothetical protein
MAIKSDRRGYRDHSGLPMDLLEKVVKHILTEDEAWEQYDDRLRLDRLRQDNNLAAARKPDPHQ